jgi:hypothetical protein
MCLFVEKLESRASLLASFDKNFFLIFMIDFEFQKIFLETVHITIISTNQFNRW